MFLFKFRACCRRRLLNHERSRFNSHRLRAFWANCSGFLRPSNACYEDGENYDEKDAPPSLALRVSHAKRLVSLPSSTTGCSILTSR
jgi:hypothetical protein